MPSQTVPQQKQPYRRRNTEQGYGCDKAYPETSKEFHKKIVRTHIDLSFLCKTVDMFDYRIPHLFAFCKYHAVRME